MPDHGPSGAVPITIYDVARLAAVSISTVSNALNRPDRVSATTRARVIAAAHDLGYVPKAQAASLARKSARRIGVFAPFTSYDSFLRRLSGLLGEASAAGIEVAVFDHGSAATLANPVLDSIPLQARFDGVVAMGIALDDAVEARLLQRGVPAVVVDAASRRFPSIVVDDFDAGSMAARHLLELGHRRFAAVAERQTSDYDSQSASRMHGVRAALDTVPGTSLVVVEADPTIEDSQARAAPLLVPGGPTAFIAHFDRMAVGVLRAARQNGLGVPEDVSVMGFDDGPIAEAADLTTIRQPFEDSGVLAFRLLLSDRTGVAPSRTELRFSLVTRSSTGPVSPAG